MLKVIDESVDIEPDDDVIASATVQRMSYLQNLQSVQRHEISRIHSPRSRTCKENHLYLDAARRWS
jgi:hypothetical protein